ncbi:plasma-membrane choline transporter-domain-containing protein [Paraphysoderma sedebokerense]|nr:plasma-membrane choline transporter-domain-containing protein [Paraphysoderma sedebokerense]
MGRTKVQPIETVCQYQTPPGPLKKRQCRDVFFLFLFAIYWGGMIVLAILAITNGNPQRLIYGQDSYGQLCGINNNAANSSRLDLSTKPFLFFFNPLDKTALQICVDKCPTESVVSTFAGANYICDYRYQAISQPDLVTKQSNKTCAKVVYKSRPIANRCVPDGNITSLLLDNYPSSNSSLDVSSLISNSRDTVQKVMSDLNTSWPYILAGVGASLVVCLIWMILLRFIAGFITWVTLLLSEAAVCGLAVYMFFEWQARVNIVALATAAQTLTDEMVWERDVALGLFIAAAVIALLMLCAIIFMRNRLRIAVQIIKEGSRAIGAMPMIMLYPGVSFLSTVVLLAYYLIIAAFIATAEEPNSLGSIKFDLGNVAIMRYLQWYHLLGFLWTAAFINGINQTVIAGSIASWYWSPDKRNLPEFPIWNAFYRTLRYSMGSIALGSLLIALTQFIRAFLLFIERQVKGKNNRIVQFIFTCLQCCFACVDRFLRFINRNAYIQIAVYGYSYCKGARTAFELLARNAFRLVAVDFVAAFIMFLGKICVTAGVGLGSYVLLKYLTPNLNLQFIAAPVLVIILGSWLIVGGFFNVYRMAIDTIFLSFCEDVERNDGSAEKPYFMPAGLKAITNLK